MTIEYILENQQQEKHIQVMKEIFTYLNQLQWIENYEVMDNFIKDFCKQKNMCFQYYVCVLSSANWVKDKLNAKTFNTLKKKAIKAGTLEIGEENTIKTLDGLI